MQPHLYGYEVQKLRMAETPYYTLYNEVQTVSFINLASLIGHEAYFEKACDAFEYFRRAEFETVVGFNPVDVIMNIVCERGPK